LGRFVGRDPIGYESGVNTVEYVWDNATNRTDPTGEQMVGGTTNVPFNTLPHVWYGPLLTRWSPPYIHCIFQAQGCPQPPPWVPEPRGRNFIKDIVTPDDLHKKCDKLSNEYCDVLTLGGHGIRDGCGFKSRDPEGKETDVYSIRCGKKSDKFGDISKCFKDKVKPGGYIRICSCGFYENPKKAAQCAQDMADETQRTVCYCPNMVDFGQKQIGTPDYDLDDDYCHCTVPWDCKSPRPESATRTK
jgi:hypothetical protein